MKINKLFLLAVTALSLMGCDFNSNDADTKLYHLTISSNKELTSEEAKQLKATYGFGQPSLTVVEGVRPEEEVQALKEAGYSDEEINNVGTRQTDGSYYFFDQDPIYIEAPQIVGYKFLGFYFKGTNELAYNPIISKDNQGNSYLQRWNMVNRDVELVATYQKWSYSVQFDTLANGDINPNANQLFCYVDNNNQELPLLPATTNSIYKTFDTWSYCKYVGDVWTRFEIDSLPGDFYEELMRVEASWILKKFSLNFKFVYDDGVSYDEQNWNDVCESISVKGNLASVDGEPTVDANSTAQDKGLPVTDESEILCPYITENNTPTWLSIFVTVKPAYKINKYKINSNNEEFFYGDLNLYGNDFDNDNSLITFVLVDNN